MRRSIRQADFPIPILDKVRRERYNLRSGRTAADHPDAYDTYTRRLNNRSPTLNFAVPTLGFLLWLSLRSFETNQIFMVV